MSLFPEYLELQRSQSWASDQKSDSHIPRGSMNKLVMDYLITGNINFNNWKKYLLTYLRTSWPLLRNDDIIFSFKEGFKEAAEKFRLEAGILPLGDKNSDLSSMDNRIKIRDCIQAGKISEATALVHQLHPELLDDDRYLFFHLQVYI